MNTFEWKGEQIVKNEIVNPFMTITCEIWKYYRYSKILNMSSEEHFISFVTKVNAPDIPDVRLSEKIGKSFESVRDWTINKFPAFEGVI